MFGGLGAHWGGSWGPISEQNGGLEDTGGDMGDLEGPGGAQRVKSINFGSHFGTLLRAKMGVKSYQKTVPKNNGYFYENLIALGAPIVRFHRK